MIAPAENSRRNDKFASDWDVVTAAMRRGWRWRVSGRAGGSSHTAAPVRACSLPAPAAGGAPRDAARSGSKSALKPFHVDDL